MQPPGPHGIVARIGNELLSKSRIPLQNLNGRNVQNAPGRSVLADTRNPKDFLHGSFSHAQELCREGLQAVTPAILQAARVLQAGHVHGVSPKTLAVDSLVPENVSIKAVIVPNLFEALVFQPLLEFLEDSVSVVQIVDPQR